MTIDDLQDFTLAYIEAALWTEDLEAWSPGDLDSGARANVDASCGSFVRTNLRDLRELAAEDAGHDFWLTRNGHGAGYWDRDLGAVGERLTEAAAAYGESWIYAGDDGRLYVA